MSISKKIFNSFTELKKVHSLSAIAMLLALRVVLGFFANGTLAFFGNTIKITGAFLPIAVTAAMFGPVPAALVGALGDIISFLLNPIGGAYFPGFTISGLLTGLIYGLFFYKNEITLPRTAIAWGVNTLLVETFLAAYWLYLLNSASGGNTYDIYLVARFISQAIKCVPEILIILLCGKIISKIKIPDKNNKQT